MKKLTKIDIKKFFKENITLTITLIIYILLSILIFINIDPKDITIGNNKPWEGVEWIRLFISIIVPFIVFLPAIIIKEITD